MATQEIVAPAEGVTLDVDTGLDLTGLTSAVIAARRPGGSEVVWSATRVGVTSRIAYTLTATDIQPGREGDIGVYTIVTGVAFGGAIIYGKPDLLSVTKKFG